MQPGCGRCNKSTRVVDFLSCRSRTGVKSEVAAMQEIADWLEKLDVSEYALRFDEDRIGAL